MRAGALDHMVAISYARQLEQGRKGLVMAVRGGVYTTVPIEICASGHKPVDAAELYDADAYPSRVRHPYGKSLFLY